MAFFTSFRIIRETFDSLNKLPVFQLFRKIIRILSIISLLFNIIILVVFTQWNPVMFISSIPGISQLGAFMYESSPEQAQGFKNWLIIKIKTFLLWIWHSLIDFIKTIIKAVLGEIENSPNTNPTIDPNEDKYKDIYNEGYLNRIGEAIYDWRF